MSNNYMGLKPLLSKNGVKGPIVAADYNSYDLQQLLSRGNMGSTGGNNASGSLMDQKIMGRAITNTSNLVTSIEAEQMAQTNGSVGNMRKPDYGDVDMSGSGKYRNGGVTDYNEFMSRNSFFSPQNTANLQRPNVSSANSSFPPIGTFSVENALAINADVNSYGVIAGDIFNGAMNISNGSNGQYNANQNNNQNGIGDPNQATRETGIIEKLLHSYGFIQCCERQARLFFHFSQFSGNIEHLKIGDPVEFEMTYDRRTGKPIASHVSKIAPDVVMSEERVTGTVTTELKADGSTTGETTGRISYENRGECFFLPYTKDDVEGNVTLRSGDKVSFQIATNNRGTLGACHVRLENPAHPVKYRGVVCSMKESFGFIERADVVKEIFFHFSEAEGKIELLPGDDVEFHIQTRNGKEVACNITRLPPGSVIFEDVGTQMYKGQVLKPLDRNNPLRHNTDPLPGRIRYRAQDHSEVEVPFGDKDQKGNFTLRHGDWVQFLLATDRRDQLQRATAISLLNETFELSGERREQGAIAALKEDYGFIRCVDRTVRLFFHFTEVLDTSREICVNDEVEFTVSQEPGANFANTRFCAVRIKHLPKGTVQFETPVESNIEGVISREAPKSPTKSLDRVEGGVIAYTQANQKKTIKYFLKDCEKPPRIGDRIRFDIFQVKRNKEQIALNIVEIYPNEGGSKTESPDLLQSQLNENAVVNNNSDENSVKHRGFIAVLKENFGFIENIDHDEEVFFHFSNFTSNPHQLELGQEVEYTLSSKPGGNSGNCLPAENVRTLPWGTIDQPKIIDTICNGQISRPLRCINPNQQEYCGLVQVMNEAQEVVSTHEFGITSLKNKRDLLQIGDIVQFKLDEAGRAAELLSVRQKKRANVDSIKGQFGFLDFEVEEGKKLFFHMSDVQGNSASLHHGDRVEFSIFTNQRSGKSSACNVIKITDNVVRPDRLLSRLKVNSVDESVPRMIAVRTPKGPSSGKGFAASARLPRLPGILTD